MVDMEIYGRVIARDGDVTIIECYNDSGDGVQVRVIGMPAVVVDSDVCVRGGFYCSDRARDVTILFSRFCDRRRRRFMIFDWLTKKFSR